MFDPSEENEEQLRNEAHELMWGPDSEPDSDDWPEFEDDDTDPGDL